MQPPQSFDYERVAAELIRKMRGKRSQTALSRRLGYKTNVVYTWEAQKGAPTGAGFFRLARKVGVDPDEAISGFYRARPRWLDHSPPDTRDGAAALLDDLKGSRTLVETATALRCSRFALARWLSGEAEPRLPDFLQAIEVMSLRLLDFIAQFVDPITLPSLSDAWARLQQARRAAYEMPWSHAILRALELEQYAHLPRHEPGWIAARLGLPEAVESEALTLLSSTGQIEWRDDKWHVASTQTIDTRSDPKAAKALKTWWFGVGRERFEADAPGVFSYNLFGVSSKDLERLQDLQRAYFRELRSIVAESQPVETVAVVNLQLFSLLGFPKPSTP